MIEHPYRGDDWKLLEPAKAAEKTADLLRFDVPVAAKASEKFTVREEHPDYETYALLDTDQDTLLAYIRSGEASAAVKAALQEVVARREAVAETNTKISDLNARLDAISQGQTRIRDNMKALDHASALYKRYVGRAGRAGDEAGVAASAEGRAEHGTGAAAGKPERLRGAFERGVGRPPPLGLATPPHLSRERRPVTTACLLHLR